MAEFVEFRMERALPEYEQMRTLNLFSDEEILNIKKTRENFEYRVAQQSRCLKDYLEYIKYERKLISLTKERVQLNKITTNNTIAVMIASRMKQLYSQALTRHSQNTRLWDEYLKFLQQFKFRSDISSTFEQMLQYHSDKDDVWIRAILWEFNENFNNERVKGLLSRAQQKHPKSKKLLLTFFQIELENKQKADEQIALQLADVVYMNGKMNFKKEIQFFIEMLNIADKFAYANPLQQTILDDMRSAFPNQELLWHTLAQRELNGMSSNDCTINFKEIVKNEKDEEEKKEEEEEDTKPNTSKMNVDPIAPASHTLRKRIQLCAQIYDEAVKVVNTQKMWIYYIDAMLELNNDLSTQAACKRSVLGRAFLAANESNRMSENHYLQYIELLHSNNPKDENIIRVFRKAVSLYKNSSKIWLQFMRLYIQADNIDKVRETFRAARLQMGSKGADLWQMYIIYLKAIQNPNTNTELERLIQEVASMPYPEFNNLKAFILEMVAVTSNIKRARKCYDLFIRHMVTCYEVHAMMADLEAKQIIRDVPAERKCLENLINHFGATRTDVWLRYMRFERNVGEPKNVGRLHAKAVSSLKIELLDDFSALYNFFSNGVV